MNHALLLRWPLLVFVLCGAGLGSCGSKKGFAPRPKPKPKISHYAIHQPDVNYPNDDVRISKKPDLEERAFMLPPGTKVEVVNTVDNKDGKIVYEIKTGDDRKGWVPKPHCKAVYK